METTRATEHEEDMFHTWEVKNGHIINRKPKKLSEVYQAVRKELELYPEIFGSLDYFSLEIEYKLGHVPDLWPDPHWIAVFYVTGDSEGYYIHVEARDGGTSKLLFLGKTLREGIEGRMICEKAVAALSRIMKV